MPLICRALHCSKHFQINRPLVAPRNTRRGVRQAPLAQVYKWEQPPGEIWKLRLPGLNLKVTRQKHVKKKKKMGQDPGFSASISSSLLSAPQGTGTSDKIFQFTFRVHSASGMGAELSIGAQWGGPMGPPAPISLPHSVWKPLWLPLAAGIPGLPVNLWRKLGCAGPLSAHSGGFTWKMIATHTRKLFKTVTVKYPFSVASGWAVRAGLGRGKQGKVTALNFWSQTSRFCRVFMCWGLNRKPKCPGGTRNSRQVSAPHPQMSSSKKKHRKLQEASSTSPAGSEPRALQGPQRMPQGLRLGLFHCFVVAVVKSVCSRVAWGKVASFNLSWNYSIFTHVR